MAFDFKRMLKFEHNVGTQEKKIRLWVGVALILLSIPFGIIMALILGIILAATGYAGWCPIYSGLSRNTCESQSES